MVPIPQDEGEDNLLVGIAQATLSCRFALAGLERQSNQSAAELATIEGMTHAACRVHKPKYLPKALPSHSLG